MRIRTTYGSASELATYLHGVVQIHLCQRGDASCSHVSHSCEVGAEGSEEEGEEGQEVGLQGGVVDCPQQIGLA